MNPLLSSAASNATTPGPGGAHAPLDSLAGFVPPSPLPDPVAATFRFFFNVPQWIQIGGFFLGLAVAGWLAHFVWRRRAPLAAWFKSRSNAFRGTVAAVAGLFFVGAVVGGTRTWNYMQHDNDFCMTCHVMEAPFERFQKSAHADLSCHDCHQQSIFASGRQMVLWVAERPVMISEHAPVPNDRCESCHVTGEADSWKRIKETAGHRIHFESKDPKLAGLLCVTCHGVEVHRFSPVDATCGTQGCHDDKKIQLAKMSNQTSLHCTVCHRFTEVVPASVDTAAAKNAIGPRLEQCNTCHGMQQLVADFDSGMDPHRAECGTCHNPHEQKTAAEAGLRCATCHEDWKKQPFHVGAAHGSVNQQCTLCHVPHRARVDASDCAGCHQSVIERGKASPATVRKLKAALPLDLSRLQRAPRDSLSTGAAPSLVSAPPTAAPPSSPLASASLSAESHPSSTPTTPSTSPLSAPLASASPVAPSPATPAIAAASTEPPALEVATSAGTFSHKIHRNIHCIKCHDPAAQASSVTFSIPMGCRDCHHGSTAQAANCVHCHAAEDLSRTKAATVTVATGENSPRTRSVNFRHAVHSDLECGACHESGRNRTVRAESASCRACHENHHTASRSCTSCHSGAEVLAAHRNTADVHTKCAQCHRAETVAALTPDRGFCLTCHDDRGTHFATDDRACSTCHFLRTPQEFRAVIAGSVP